MLSIVLKLGNFQQKDSVFLWIGAKDPNCVSVRTSCNTPGLIPKIVFFLIFVALREFNLLFVFNLPGQTYSNSSNIYGLSKFSSSLEKGSLSEFCFAFFVFNMTALNRTTLQ